MESCVLKVAGNKNYYKNSGAIRRLILYVLAPGKTYWKNSRPNLKVRYSDSNYLDISNPNEAIKQIKGTKKYFGNTDGRQMYHYILSFPSKVKNPEKVYEIGLGIMDKIFYEYQAIFAVHEDTDNLHIHFVFNSVSHVTGKKWCPKNKEFQRIKRKIISMGNSCFCDI